MYQPFVFKLPNIILDSKTITSDDNNIEISNIKPYPYFTLGFHSFIHRTRNAMDIIKNLQTKIEFYFVVNPFENNISNYNDDLISSTDVSSSFCCFSYCSFNNLILDIKF